MTTAIVMIDYRRSLAERAKARKFCGPYRWTPTTAPSKGRGFYQSRHGLFMDPAGSSFTLRLEEANDHLPGRNASGYFVDDYCGDTLQPIIARLPNRRGFLAGWTMGAGMCATLDADIHADAESAAYAAHSIAEADAEAERDRQADDLEDAA